MTNDIEEKFLEKLLKDSTTPINIMSLEHINQFLDGIMPPIKKRGIQKNEYTVLNVAARQEFEGMHRIVVFDVIPPGEKVLSRKRQHIVWGQALPTVVIPIVLRNAGKDYMVLISQSRFCLGGKVSIEVNRGYITEPTDFEKRPFQLLARKMPYIGDITKLVKAVHIGTFWENTGLLGIHTPIWGIFCETKVDIDIADLKQLLKDRHDGKTDPKTGPPLHNTEPVLRTIEEVKGRISEILENPTITNEQAYLNDLFSMTALQMLFSYISKNGFPY